MDCLDSRAGKNNDGGRRGGIVSCARLRTNQRKDQMDAILLEVGRHNIDILLGSGGCALKESRLARPIMQQQQAIGCLATAFNCLRWPSIARSSRFAFSAWYSASGSQRAAAHASIPDTCNCTDICKHCHGTAAPAFFANNRLRRSALLQ